MNTGKGGEIYILTNQRHTVLYIGVTAELLWRIREHKNKVHPTSFTAKYNCNKLVYYELYSSIEEAIAREKKLKGWIREKKIKLIETINPKWDDLFETEVKHW